MFASSVVVPISVGAAFHLPIYEVASLLQRTFFMVGAASLLQVFFGHRMPIAEGPSGLWWGVFLIFAGISSSMDIAAHSILQSLEMGLFISGLLFIILSLFKTIHIIKKIFTPLVTGTYLFLLASQLSGSFMKGIFGVGYLKDGIDPKVAILALITLLVTVAMARGRYMMLRNFYVLFGMIFGWILFTAFGANKPIEVGQTALLSIPQLFVWGIPKLDVSIIITCLITALLLLSNLIASVDIVKKTIDQQKMPDYNRSGLVMGINQVLSGLFSTTGFVPLSTTAGFIATTGIKERLPFIIGSIIILIISFFPGATLFFSGLPVPVGYATIFLVYANMIRLALKEYSTSAASGDNKLLIIGCSMMVGIGSNAVPAAALKDLPSFIAPLLNNGLILGVITCIILEQGIVLKNRYFLKYNKIA